MNIRERERVSAAESARRTAHEPGYIAVRDRAEVRRGRRAARRHEEQMFRARARACCVCVCMRTHGTYSHLQGAVGPNRPSRQVEGLSSGNVKRLWVPWTYRAPRALSLSTLKISSQQRLLTRAAEPPASLRRRPGAPRARGRSRPSSSASECGRARSRHHAASVCRSAGTPPMKNWLGMAHAASLAIAQNASVVYDTG